MFAKLILIILQESLTTNKKYFYGCFYVIYYFAFRITYKFEWLLKSKGPNKNFIIQRIRYRILFYITRKIYNKEYYYWNNNFLCDTWEASQNEIKVFNIFFIKRYKSKCCKIGVHCVFNIVLNEDVTVVRLRWNGMKCTYRVS